MAKQDQDTHAHQRATGNGRENRIERRKADEARENGDKGRDQQNRQERSDGECPTHAQNGEDVEWQVDDEKYGAETDAGQVVG